MKDKKEKFTIDKAIEYQTKQLLTWERKLKPEVYIDLKEWATETNSTVTKPDQVRRGTDLDNFIANWKPKDMVKLLASIRQGEITYKGKPFVFGVIEKYDGSPTNIIIALTDGTPLLKDDPIYQILKDKVQNNIALGNSK